MPYSDGSLRPWLLKRMQESLSEPEWITDIGAGAGLNVDYFAPHFPSARWRAVEVWEPYVREFDLTQRYHTVQIGDARRIPHLPSDVTIFGDVLEHMPRLDALDLWNRARAGSRWLAISLPIVHYPQGAEFGNPFEAHLYHWSASEVLDSFPGIQESSEGDVVGAFWAKGDLD